MIELLDDHPWFVGPAGSPAVPDHDRISRKLVMRVESTSQGLGPTRAARKCGCSKTRYYQLLGRDQGELRDEPRSDAMCRPTLRGGGFRRAAAATIRRLKC